MKNKELVGIKIVFFVMIFLIMFIIFMGLKFTKDVENLNLWISASKIADNNLSKINLLEFIYNNTENDVLDYNNSIPICSNNERVIILRLDDVKAWQYFDITEEMVSLVLSKNMTLSLAVIPKDIEKDSKLFLPWINDIKSNNNIEIALHGYLHQGAEFKNLSEEEATDKIKKGKELLLNYIGIIPITFIPPENEFSNETLNALAGEGFRVISAGDNTNKFNQLDNLLYIGKTTNTYDFTSEKLIPAEQTLAECNSNLNDKGLCVIVIHPQDYLTKDRTNIDKEKYSEYVKLIEGLENLNATFKNFKDVANCGS